MEKCLPECWGGLGSFLFAIIWFTQSEEKGAFKMQHTSLHWREGFAIDCVKYWNNSLF